MHSSRSFHSMQRRAVARASIGVELAAFSTGFSKKPASVTLPSDHTIMSCSSRAEAVASNVQSGLSTVGAGRSHTEPLQRPSPWHGVALRAHEVVRQVALRARHRPRTRPPDHTRAGGHRRCRPALAPAHSPWPDRTRPRWHIAIPRARRRRHRAAAVQRVAHVRGAGIAVVAEPLAALAHARRTGGVQQALVARIARRPVRQRRLHAPAQPESNVEL